MTNSAVFMGEDVPSKTMGRLKLAVKPACERDVLVVVQCSCEGDITESF